MDGLEAIAAIVYVLMQWRVFTCLAGTLGLAFLLSGMTWTSGPQLIVIALSGLLIGTVWQARASAHTKPENGPTSTSRPTQHAAAALVGVVWGAASASSWQAVAFGTSVLAILGGLWLYYATSVRHWLATRAALKALVTLAIAFGVSAVISHGA